MKTTCLLLTFCLVPFCFSSLTCCPKPLSSDQCPWPFVLAPISFYTNASFSSAPLLLSLTITHSFCFYSFFFSCISSILLCSLVSLNINMYSRQATATSCWFIESTQGMQIPSLFPIPFRPCWPAAAGDSVIITTWCQDLSFFLLLCHFTCKL